jgi:prevent-host-death family protein
MMMASIITSRNWGLGTMKQVTAREANRRFSEILSAVETGEEVVVTKHGRPVAVLSPYRATPPSPERRAAIDYAIAVMDEPLNADEKFRAFSRDEMHEHS